MAKDEDRHQWETLLAKVEQDLTEYEKKMQPLRSMVTYLRSLLELPIEDKTEGHITPDTVVATGTLPKFREGDFFGLGQAEAGHKVLKRAGHSLNVEEILKVLTKNGYDIGGQDQKRTLYGSLCRSRKLVLVASNTFDLAERRPQTKKPQMRRTKGEKKEEKAQSEVQT